MGPDHSQIEIYEESKHGVMFHAQEQLLNLDAPPKTLTTRDMFVPTCATCHMSGINGLKVTHDPSERLSYYLADAITEKRPNYAAGAGQDEADLHAVPHHGRSIDRVYTQAEQVVDDHQRRRCSRRRTSMDGLRKDGVLTGPPFSTADRLRLLRPVALRRPHREARRVHGRRGLRAVARQLPDAAEARSS